MNPDLLRQRRNLILISVALLIFDFADVRIAKVSLLGTELLVGNVKVLMVCAWLLWLYFLIRYYQYWRAGQDESIRTSFRWRLNNYTRSYTKATAKRDHAGAVYDDYVISRTGRFTWNYTLRNYDPAEGMLKSSSPYGLPVWRLVLWHIKSAAYVCVQTPHATDHALPFALAFSAPIVTLISKQQL